MRGDHLEVAIIRKMKSQNSFRTTEITPMSREKAYTHTYRCDQLLTSQNRQRTRPGRYRKNLHIGPKGSDNLPPVA